MECLTALIAEWRGAVGDDMDWDIGYQTARNRCADELETFMKNDELRIAAMDYLLRAFKADQVDPSLVHAALTLLVSAPAPTAASAPTADAPRR